MASHGVLQLYCTGTCYNSKLGYAPRLLGLRLLCPGFIFGHFGTTSCWRSSTSLVQEFTRTVNAVCAEYSEHNIRRRVQLSIFLVCNASIRDSFWLTIGPEEICTANGFDSNERLFLLPCENVAYLISPVATGWFDAENRLH